MFFCLYGNIHKFYTFFYTSDNIKINPRFFSYFYSKLESVFCQMVLILIQKRFVLILVF
nr:MAG TPA: hypothetical protein [Caudoviricetes sp.]